MVSRSCPQACPMVMTRCPLAPSRHRPALGLAALASGVLMALSAAAPAQAARQVATVREILDGNELFVDAKQAKVNQKARTPDVISTKASRGMVAFASGATARINRNSQFKLQSDCFLLTSGQVLVSGPQNTCLPSVKLSSRGTNYLVTVLPDGSTELKVMQGTVTLQPIGPAAATTKWAEPVEREAVRINAAGQVTDRRCLVSRDYNEIVGGSLFTGFEQPLTNFQELGAYLAGNVPVVGSVLSALSFGLF